MDVSVQIFLLLPRRSLGNSAHESYNEALESGYDQLGDGPFLVKQVLLHEPSYRLGAVEL